MVWGPLKAGVRVTSMVRGIGRGLAGRRPRVRGVRGVPRLRAGGLLLLVLVLAVGVLASGVVTLYLRSHRAELTDQARGSAVQAARSHAKEILSYDYRTLDHDLSAAKSDTTGDLRKKYGKLTSKLVGPKAQQHKVVVRAQVAEASVTQASPDRVVALLFVNQVTQSDLLDGPRIDQNRVRMTLTKVDGSWLASDIAAL